MKQFRIIASVMAAMLLAASCDKDDKITVPSLPPNTAAVRPEAGIPGNYVEYVQLWENGPKFAVMNVGATDTLSEGDYFAWGETEPYYKAGQAEMDPPEWKDGKSDGYTWKSYSDTRDRGVTFSKYNKDGGKTILDREDDAAYVNWGPNWRMPTWDEIEKLTDEDYVEQTFVADYEGTGMSGYVFKGKAGTQYEDNKLFLPLGIRQDSTVLKLGTGGYWSSSLSAGNNMAKGLSYLVAFPVSSCELMRMAGIHIRPILYENEPAPAPAPAPGSVSGNADVSGVAGVLGNKVGWVQLWENGPKFAKFDVGAIKEGGSGWYFAWGETDHIKFSYDWESYFDSNNDGTVFTKYKNDGKTVLESANDAATAIWGSNWRMPTAQELKNLLSTDYTDGGTWVEKFGGKMDGLPGWLFKGKAGTRFQNCELFMPVQDFRVGPGSSSIVFGLYSGYWSSSLSAYSSYEAMSAVLRAPSETQGNMNFFSTFERSDGLYVRPVLK